jgi:hypothetical protein
LASSSVPITALAFRSLIRFSPSQQSPRAPTLQSETSKIHQSIGTSGGDFGGGPTMAH